MPTIKRFGSIKLTMYAAGHNPPHVHVIGSDFAAQISISDGEILNGNCPVRHRRAILRWIDEHREMLIENWNRLTDQERKNRHMDMHRLESVVPFRGKRYGLKIVWDDGRVDVVDMSGVIYRYTVFAPLRGDQKLFRAVRRVDRGYGIAWGKNMDYSAQSLRRLADEQRPMSGRELRLFETEHHLTASETAAVLDVAVRTVKAYRRARRLPVPVAIAIRAMRAEPALLAAHYRPPLKARRAA